MQLLNYHKGHRDVKVSSQDASERFINVILPGEVKDLSLDEASAAKRSYESSMFLVIAMIPLPILMSTLWLGLPVSVEPGKLCLAMRHNILSLLIH